MKRGNKIKSTINDLDMNGMVLTDNCSIFNAFSRLLILFYIIWVSRDDVSLEFDKDMLYGLYNNTSSS